MRSQGLVVAIDGPTGAGKSTAGRTLAERLGYTNIDTNLHSRGGRMLEATDRFYERIHLREGS
jgi:cytidylate kinase